jgi:phosphate transport system substrate-binding protein
MKEPLLQSMAIIMTVLALTIALYFIVLAPDTRLEGYHGTLVINGAGSTLIAPQILEWSKEFTEKTGIVIEYSPTGSGAGRAMLFNKTVVFAVSDPPLDRETYLEYRGRILQLPIVLSAIVITYNIPGIPRDIQLNLTGRILALIYKGEITRWNDKRIKEANPAIADLLPDKEIVVVHRSDSSGTTRIFTGYLNKAAPDIWGIELVGFSIEWPVDRSGRGLGGKGNEGVAGLVISTPYSIGYIEASYALYAGMPVARLENKEGYFVTVSRESVLSAVRHVLDQLPSSPLEDFSMVLDTLLNTPGPDSYPIVSFSYMLIYSDYGDVYVTRALSRFIEYILIEGQDRLLPGYYQPPDEVIKICLKALEIISRGSWNG